MLHPWCQQSAPYWPWRWWVSLCLVSNCTQLDSFFQYIHNILGCNKNFSFFYLYCKSKMLYLQKSQSSTMMFKRLTQRWWENLKLTYPGLFWCRVCNGDPVTAFHKRDGSRDRIHLLQLQLGPAALWTPAVSTHTHTHTSSSLNTYYQI